MAKKSRIRKATPHQKKVVDLLAKITILERTNTALNEDLKRAEIRDNDRKTSLQAKDEHIRTLADKHTAAVAERERIVRLVDQFTSIQIHSPTSESRALRNTNGVRSL